MLCVCVVCVCASGFPAQKTAMAYESQQSLRLLESGEASTLAEIRAGRPLVLDFWHTRCGNCPEALTKLDALAASGKLPGVAFAACALSLGEGSFEQTAELVDDEWEHLTHLFMSTDEKEVAKAEFGFSAVPFCVAFAADGAGAAPRPLRGAACPLLSPRSPSASPSPGRPVQGQPQGGRLGGHLQLSGSRRRLARLARLGRRFARIRRLIPGRQGEAARRRGPGAASDWLSHPRRGLLKLSGAAVARVSGLRGRAEKSRDGWAADRGHPRAIAS